MSIEDQIAAYKKEQEDAQFARDESGQTVAEMNNPFLRAQRLENEAAVIRRDTPIVPFALFQHTAPATPEP